jgi:hypothetical protein
MNMPDRRMIAVIVACMLGIALFLGVSAANGQPGFPLDDAWIHQTYARNLARSGRFEFVPGVSSAGSTAPLWTLLLVVGYLLRLPYLFWTFLLGGLSLLWLAWAAMQLWRSLWPRQADKDWLAAIITALTWPLLWAAASGMETLLFAALGLQIIALYSKQSPISNLHSLLLPGLLSGLLVLTRPDGVVLLFLLVLGLAVASGSMFDRAKRIAVLAATAVLPLLPYFLFNTWSSGHLWPNTYYAKQTEYAILLARPFIGRLAQLLFFSLGGPESGWQGMSSAHLLLLPGVIVAGWQALRADWTHKRLCHVLPLLWAGGHVFLYAWRLPVMFQHGRYIQPIIPVWVLFGLAGWLMLSFNLSESTRTLWLGRQVIRLTFFVIMGVFY